MLIIDDDTSLRKNSQDDDTYGAYGCRGGNDSDAEDSYSSSGIRRNDSSDVTSNVDMLHRRAKDNEMTGSSAAVRPFISTPQYHLTPTEDEELERRQSSRGQQLERMKYRRNARLSRQSAGVSTADTVPGFRGEASVEELMSYIDAPALAAADCKTVRKAKKKKKKALTAETSLESGAQRLANSCEVFVGVSGVSSDEPCVRVGDSCCIELRKKSSFDSLPDSAGTAVSTPGSNMCESAEADTTSIVNSQNGAASGTDSSHLDVDIVEGLCEVGYTTVASEVLQDDSTAGIVTESVGCALAGDETLLAAEFATSEVVAEVMGDVDVEFAETTTEITDSICSLTAQCSFDSVAASLPLLADIDNQYELDSVLPSLSISDSVTSDTGSIEDLFVTVQKKKRTKNTAVAAEDVWPRFSRRSSGTKGVEDVNYCVKRSWVKSSDSACVVPSVSVSRSSVMTGCKPSCSASQRTGGLAGGQYSQASYHDTVLSSAVVARKCLGKSSSSSVSVESEPDSIKEQTSNSKSAVGDSACISSSERNTAGLLHRSKENAKTELKSDSLLPVSSVSPVDGIITTHWQSFSQQKPVDEPDSKQVSLGMPAEMPDVTCDATNVSEKPSVDLTARDKSSERSAIETDVQLASIVGSVDQLADVVNVEKAVESMQAPVQNANTSDVFLDTRNIAGTTPPRADISFGFDLLTSCVSSPSPELLPDAGVSSPAAGAQFPPLAPAASPHCPLITRMPAPPLLYFYPAMPVTLLPPVAAFPTSSSTGGGLGGGRCTPVGVVPPMPVAVAAEACSIAAAPTWQLTQDKITTLPLPHDQHTAVVNNSTLATHSTSNRATSEFVLLAAQRYLYSGTLYISVNFAV